MLQHTEGIAGQLSSLFADAPVGLVVLDAERRYVMVNAALARLHGRSADELVGRRIDEVAPELAAALGPVFDRVLAGERVADVELEVGAATTRESFFPVRAADGMVIGIGGVIADVTDLRHVHDSERYLRELLGEELRAERGIADTLQRSLLPRSLPTIPGAAVAARYEAAGARFDVGGDFYDAFALPGGRWMLVVGDVCGKGPEAAGMTAMARYTLRAAAPHVDGPAELLARLNDEMLLHESGDGEEIVRFVTAAAACVQPVAGGFEARIAAAGHPDPLVLRAGGAVERFAASGPPCGIVAAAQYAEQRALLGAADALIVYTDGVLEAGAPARQLDIPELGTLLTARAGSPADTLAEAVARIVAECGEGDPHDDFAVLVFGVA